MYKVIQWAPGNVGKFCVEHIIGHPDLKLVGVKCFSDSKEGVDAGILCGGDPVGIVATKDTERLLASEADCVLFACGDPTLQDPLPGTMGFGFLQSICQILESGKKFIKDDIKDEDFLK